MKKKWIWIAAIAVVAIVVVAMVIHNRGRYAWSFTTQAVTRGSIENTVTATGEIQPVYKVEVGTQVSGIVKKLYVDYNTEVKKGDLLAELDKSTLQEQVKQSRASLSTATSNKELAQKKYDRINQLYLSKAATQEEYDQAETELQQAKNQMITAQSNYENAVTNLKYAEIYSPIDGVVLGKEVEEGQTVASSFSTPTLFTIANDLTQMQVEANVDEADIGQVKQGQAVTFTVDAFPGSQFTGTVKQIRLDPTVTSNVVTYTVIIDAPNPDSKLYPGMTANVSIIVEQQDGLVFPLQATYYNPQEQAAALAKDGYTIAPVKGERVPGRAIVYVLKDKTLQTCCVETGLDDGANIMAASGVEEGDVVVLSATREKVSKGRQKEAVDNPFSMGPPKQKQR